MLYYGTITKVIGGDTGTLVMVTIHDLGGDHQEFGPMPIMGCTFGLGGHWTGPLHPMPPSSFDSHIHAIEVEPYLPGLKVIVGQVGLIKENLIVLGRVLPVPYEVDPDPYPSE